MKHYQNRFPSWSAYIDYVEKSEKSPDWTSEKVADAESSERTKFTGTKSFPAALLLARQGWPEGIGKIRAAAGSIAQRQPGHARAYDVAGMYPDAARAAAGDPCAMITPMPGEIRAPAVVSLIIPCGGNCNVLADSFTNRAGAIANFCDALESSGFSRLELWAHWGVEPTNRLNARWDRFVSIKSPENPLDLANLAAVCHPSALRRLGFRTLEAFTEGGSAFTRGCFGSYGKSIHPQNLPHEELPAPMARILPPVENGRDYTPAASWRNLEAWANENGLNVATTA